MKVIQKMNPRIVPDASIEYVACCAEARRENNPLRPLHHDASIRLSYDEHTLTDRDLRIRYCPHCGSKIEIINMMPSRHDIQRLVQELYHTYGFYAPSSEDSVEISTEEISNHYNLDEAMEQMDWRDNI